MPRYGATWNGDNLAEDQCVMPPPHTHTQIHAIHHHLGVCPQFDIQHADLTVEEHLLFYARLKGVKWNSEKEVVTRALRQVRKLFVHYMNISYALPVYSLYIHCTGEPL